MKTNKYKYTTDLNEPLIEVTLDEYYLVIGVEVNVPTAYKMEYISFSLKKANHQYLSGKNSDYGHAFFYVVKNDEVLSFFSFGPSGGKTGGGTMYGSYATCQYSIQEVTQLYVMKINSREANSIRSKVASIYKQTHSEIYDEDQEEWVKYTSDKKKYRVMTNETCAKEAYEILSSVLGTDRVPAAGGYIKTHGISKKVKCPYAWNDKLSNSSLKHFIFPEYPQIGKAKELLAVFRSPHVILPRAGDLRYTFLLRSLIAVKMNLGIMHPYYSEDTSCDWFLLEGDIDPLKMYLYF